MTSSGLNSAMDDIFGSITQTSGMPSHGMLSGPQTVIF